MNKSFFSYSNGCRVNEAEKESFDRLMVREGFVFEPVKPDICIINTCAVTQKAEREARQLIYQLRKNNPKSKIVITGCSATYWQKNNLYKELPIDLLVDNVNKEYLVKIIIKCLCRDALQCVSTNKIINNKFNKSGRYIIKIQDGCQRFCTYCIVPYLRGLPKSKTIEEIINESNNLIRRDALQCVSTIKEIILTAINTEAFGYKTKENIVQLINRLIDGTDIPRISFGSIHPWSINEDFFNLYKNIISKNRLVNFFHIPLQSGSNKILNLMKRNYTREELIEKLKTIKKINPKSFIATDIIVGFLDETDRDFQDTYDFLKLAPIDKFHIFRYSPRNNTAAYFMKKSLKEPTPQEKITRAKILSDLSLKKYQQFITSLIGWQSPCLILDKKVGDYHQGLLDNQIPTLIKTDKQPGDIINVKVSEIKNNILISSSRS